MKELRWSQEKSAVEKRSVVCLLMNWLAEILGIERNPSREHQRIMLLRCGDMCGLRRMLNPKVIIFKNSFFQVVNILKSILRGGFHA